jgi:hypothetical protein
VKLFNFLCAATASATARMFILALPARMLLVRIKPPAEHKMLAVLVAVLLGLHGLPDHSGQFAVGFVAAFVGGLGVLGVRLDARQRHPSLALGRLACSAFEFCAPYLGIDFWHFRAPCRGEVMAGG